MVCNKCNSDDISFIKSYLVLGFLCHDFRCRNCDSKIKTINFLRLRYVIGG
jgi:hypothetical protein